MSVSVSGDRTGEGCTREERKGSTPSSYLERGKKDTLVTLCLSVPSLGEDMEVGRGTYLLPRVGWG